MSATPEREAAIFNAARKLPVGERSFYLDGACAGDTFLRQQVEALLKANKEAGAFLSELAPGNEESEPVGAVPDPEATLRVVPTRSEQTGDRIDRYKLMEKVGEGGCGVVYVAEQNEPVRRRVALKVIKLGMDTKSVVARFEAERQALAMMDHSNIAKVLDAGTTAQGRPYFVMELVRGIRITDYCDQAQLSTRQRLELFIPVCQAIQHAHQKGIIHRDIKPSNILVTLHDGVPVPKVIDFGIAKATEGRLTDQTVYTQLHQFIGTPAYMSPEQAEMSGLDIDTRSDIYSLGVLLYELLVGSTPFDAQELMALGLDQLRRTIREQEPTRPSTKLATLAGEALTTTAKRRSVEASQLSHLLRGDLDWIVMKCLEKDRARRYETANGLAVDLKRHLNNEPVVARPPSNLYRLQKMVCRNKMVFGAAAVVAVALVSGTLVSTWQMVVARRAQQETEVARQGEQQQRLQAQSALQMAEAEKQRADVQAQNATESQRQAERSLYAASMNLAQEAWQRNKVGHVRQLLEETAINPHRGFEWYYWQRQAHLELFTLRGHGASVQAVAFSPDGRQLVTGSYDDTGKARGNAKLWDVTTGKELVTFKGYNGGILSAAFSPDGQRVAVSGWDDTAKVWEAATGKELVTLKGHHIQVWAVAFSRDGQRLVTGGDKAIKVWDATTGKEVLSLKTSGGVPSVTFSPDGRRLVTGSWGRAAQVWDAVTGQEQLTLNGHAGAVRSVAISPDGQRVVTGSYDQTAKVWDAVTGQELLTLRGHSGEIPSVAYSPDGRRIVTGSHDQTAKVWDAVTGQELLTLKGHTRFVRAVAFSPDGRRIVTGSADNTTKIWDADLSQELTLRGHRGHVRAVAFSKDGQRIITGSFDGTVKVWEALSGKEVQSLEGHGAQIRALALSPDGQRIVTGGSDGTAKLWETTTGKQFATLQGHDNWINSVAYSHDGQRIVTSSHDQTARVWDARSGQELLVFKGHSDAVIFAAFSPDGQRVATASADRTAKVWDTTTGQERLTFKGHSDAVLTAAFSPDGQTLVTGSGDFTTRLWDAGNGRNLFTLKGHSADVISAAFSQNGQRIVTGSWDATAKVWDTKSGKELLSLGGHSAGILSVAFSPDDQRLVSASWDNTAKVWLAVSAPQVADWRREEQAVDERVQLELAAAAETERTLQTQDIGAIKQWLVLVPLPEEAHSSEEALQREQIPQEADLHPRAGQRITVGQSKRVWRAIQLENHILNFTDLLGEPTSGSVAYAVSYVQSKSEQSGLLLKVGSDNGSKVYLNGRQLFQTEISAFVPDQHVTTGVQLQAGVNVLVFKVVSGGRWLGSVRFMDAEGQPVKGLKVTLTPP
jgi:WD40 repeat protein/serine/threonine protein kinase